MKQRIQQVAAKLGGPGAAERAAGEVEEAIRLRRALVVAAEERIGDREEGVGARTEGTKG